MRRSQAGFTLIEMMVVIVIIGIIAGLAIVQLSGRADKAKVEATKAKISQISQALDLFKLDHNRYPQRLDDLLTPPSDLDVKKWPPGGYLKQYPKDGWDREFRFQVPGTKGQPYDIISFGEDGREGGESYAEDLWNHEAYKR
jgi:general secretion pathway protein G